MSDCVRAKAITVLCHRGTRYNRSVWTSIGTLSIFEQVEILVKRPEPFACTGDDRITIRLYRLSFSGDLYNASNQPLMICDRCHDVEEIVVALMQIQAVEETWALCGSCVGELPAGLKVA
jgi:hypothetical protein